ncbi:MAG TPA: protein kinase [Myxococcota bacterium]|nr:protein kinase [Myxococcota bacterium]
MKDVSIPIPEQIGPYRVLRPLAQGGMAAVFEVEDPNTREHLALKLLTHRGLAMPRFAREFRALTRLDHPNIVRVYRFGVHDGAPYLTMELLDGVPVQAYAKSVSRPGKPVRTREVLRIIACVADALDYLHQRGIVHRDLKSANILVLHDRRVKLLDFGTARIITNSDHITRHGEFVGTFAYASPEQITGGTVDSRSDLYSMGALLYRLCTGKRVFEADTPHKLARMHVEISPRPPRQLVPALPEPVEQLILRLLEKDPAKRPPSARAVSDAIRGRHGALGVDRGGLVLGSPSRLAGREAELAAIRSTLEKGKPARTVLVTGPPGSGRGRLLRSAVAEARKKGWRVFDGGFAGLPGLGVLSELITKCWQSLPPADRLDLDEEITWIRAANEKALSGDLDPTRRAEVVRSIAVVLRARSMRDEAPVCMALFDLHRSSPVALDVLASVRQRLREEIVPVVFLCSSTDDSEGPGAVIKQRLPDAWRLRLKPLSVREVQEMVHQMLGGTTPPPELVSKLHEVTGGLPGYVEEVMRAMVQAGLITAHQEGATLTWLDRSGGRVTIPGSAREAITFRLDGIDKVGTRVLEALAVAGGTATAEVLAHALDTDLEGIVRKLDGLVLRGVIRSAEESGEELWRFRLGMTRDLVLERLRPSRRSVMRRRMADVVSGQPPSANKILLLAAAERADEALSDCVSWGLPLLEWNRCLELLPVLEAVERIVPAAHGISPVQLAKFYLLFGRCLQVVRPGDSRMEDYFKKAGSLSNQPQIRGEVDLYYARTLVDRGDLEAARMRLDRAHAALPAGARPRVRSRISRDLGRLRWLQGGFDDAERWFDEALDAARRDGDDREVARCLVSRGATSQASGHMRRSETQLREAIRLYETCGDRDGAWDAQANLCEILRLSCRFSEALEMLEAELRVAHATGALHRYAVMVINVAEIEIEMLRLGRARERLSALQAELEPGTHIHLQAASAVARGRIAIASGEHRSVGPLLAPVVELCEQRGIRVAPDLMRAYMAEALVLCGRETEGVELFDEALSHLRRDRHVPSLGEACVARARAFMGREDPEVAFKPVLRWLGKEPAVLIRMEYLLAAVRHAVLIGNRERATAYLLATRELLGDVRGNLSRADRETLRVHPWNLFVRRGLNRSVAAKPVP